MMNEKTELLEEYDNLIKVKQKLDFNYFLYMLLVITFIAMFAFPKIYINQQIYYTSRDIAKLQVEYETLQEENKLIRTSVESIKFKNQVLDTMF
jgi:cell division protein FtsL